MTATGTIRSSTFTAGYLSLSLSFSIFESNFSNAKEIQLDGEKIRDRIERRERERGGEVRERGGRKLREKVSVIQ